MTAAAQRDRRHQQGCGTDRRMMARLCRRVFRRASSLGSPLLPPPPAHPARPSRRARTTQIRRGRRPVRPRRHDAVSGRRGRFLDVRHVRALLLRPPLPPSSATPPERRAPSLVGSCSRDEEGGCVVRIERHRRRRDESRGRINLVTTPRPRAARALFGVSARARRAPACETNARARDGGSDNRHRSGAYGSGVPGDGNDANDGGALALFTCGALGGESSIRGDDIDARVAVRGDGSGGTVVTVRVGSSGGTLPPPPLRTSAAGAAAVAAGARPIAVMFEQGGLSDEDDGGVMREKTPHGEAQTSTKTRPPRATRWEV